MKSTRESTLTHTLVCIYVPGRLPRISAAVIFHDVDAWRHRHATPPEIRAGSAKKKEGNKNKKESMSIQLGV